MKRLAYILTILALGFIGQASAQKAPQVVKLSQIEGEFNEQSLELKAGTYIFEVTNESVERAVGLVVANTNDAGAAGSHIQEGYLPKTIAAGETAQSRVVTLEAGTYKYFCPLNPTPEYTITVSE